MTDDYSEYQLCTPETLSEAEARADAPHQRPDYRFIRVHSHLTGSEYDIEIREVRNNMVHANDGADVFCLTECGEPSEGAGWLYCNVGSGLQLTAESLAYCRALQAEQKANEPPRPAKKELGDA